MNCFNPSTLFCIPGCRFCTLNRKLAASSNSGLTYVTHGLQPTVSFHQISSCLRGNLSNDEGAELNALQLSILHSFDFPQSFNCMQIKPHQQSALLPFSLSNLLAVVSFHPSHPSHLSVNLTSVSNHAWDTRECGELIGSNLWMTGKQIQIRRIVTPCRTSHSPKCEFG